MRNLLRQLRPLDQQLDVFLLPLALVDISPPNRTLVLAAQTKVLACLAERLSLVTLLASKTASEASCWRNKRQQCEAGGWWNWNAG